jgi:redox-sensitive bicupin YhaK (pirin superfamily)
MRVVRHARDRGHFDHGWLDTSHTFSFSEYYDPQWMGFRVLRVINEDRVQPGAGFPTHGHRDMEILTYVLEGALAHKDSTGGGGVIRPGDLQRMSAGTGVRHSEFNASPTEPVHFLQIWIEPGTRGIAPGYEQHSYDRDRMRGTLRLVAAPDPGDGVITIHQEVRVYATILEPGQKATHTLGAGRHAWVQVARGAIDVNGTTLAAGDGLAASDEPAVALVAREPSEGLLFDLP